MTSRRSKEARVPNQSPSQPYFYVGDRFCVNFDLKKPYTHKHKMVVGPWKDRRALIECMFGYHNYATYSASLQDIGFDPQWKTRAFRAYIKGYYWRDFADAKGDLTKCTPIPDSAKIKPNQWIVVSSHTLPPWAPRYLPSKRYAFIKDKVPAQSVSFEGGRGGDAREKEKFDLPRNRWEHEYWPRGMSHKTRWQRKHFSNFDAKDEAMCRKAWSSLPESKLRPGQIMTTEFKSLFKKQKEREANVIPAGIPKTMMDSMFRSKEHERREDEIRKAYEAACEPIRARFPRATREALLHHHTLKEIEKMEDDAAAAVKEAQDLAEAKANELLPRQLTFEDLFRAGSEEEETSDSGEDEEECEAKKRRTPERSKQIQEPRLLPSYGVSLPKTRAKREARTKPSEVIDKGSTESRSKSSCNSPKTPHASAKDKSDPKPKASTQTKRRRSPPPPRRSSRIHTRAVKT